MMRRLAIVPLVVGATVAALVATVVMPSPSSEAFWSASTSGGSSAAQATSVQQVGTPTATVANRNAITVSWPAATLGDGTAVTGYTLTRTSSTGQVVAATGGCAGTVTATTCTEAGVADGRWTYAVVAQFATSWVGPASASSATVIADTVAPTNALRLSASNGSAALIGTTVYYRGIAAGTIRLTNAVSDGLSGPGGSATGTLTGGNRWTHAPGRIDSPTGGPYVLNPVSWTAGTSTTQTLGIDGFDVAGNNAPVTITFVNDSTAPTGGAITYVNGTVRTASSTAAVPVATESVADAGGSGVVARSFFRRTATLTGDTCGTFGAWAQIASTGSTGQITIDDQPSVGTCVQYRHLVEDAAGNVSELLNANVVKVKPPYASTVRSTPNLMHQYTFDGSGSSIMADTPTGSNSGTTTSDATRPTPTPGAIAGESSTAASFDGTDDYVRVGRGSIGASFSIELWFLSTQGLTSGTSGHWYHGAGLVDAETPGVQNDFGISLSADGRVLAGVGNPDTTIRSQAGLNDGRWHHVVMTRDQASGLVILYVDGVEVARYSAAQASRQTLGASTYIDIGRLQTGINYYRGSIDEVGLYTVALTPAQVAEHFGAAR